ncbi:MAG TPA: oxidative damage protection protein [Gammaproteobacteria bacterium]|jgi:Fe-S cluster biosynthesis and repair protein YggX|nr:oxidative damage protection protein [Gammaproteobacteria bacterium]
MSRTVKCEKLGKEAEGLDFQSWPGDLGLRIYENISKEAWAMWINHQTMLINEYRLNPMDPKSKEFVVGEMEKFLFGEGAELPDEFVAPEEK